MGRTVLNKHQIAGRIGYQRLQANHPDKLREIRSKGGRVAIELNRKKYPTRTPTEINEKFCELLGAMFGDGCLIYLGKGKKFIALSGNYRNDYGYLNILNEWFEELFGRTARIRKEKNKNSALMQFCSKDVFEFFVRHGMPIGRKKGKLTVPYWINAAPERFRKAFLRGLFDTDGGIYLGPSKRIHFYSIDEPFIKEVTRMLAEPDSSQLSSIGKARRQSTFVAYHK